MHDFYNTEKNRNFKFGMANPTINIQIQHTDIYWFLKMVSKKKNQKLKEWNDQKTF